MIAPQAQVDAEVAIECQKTFEFRGDLCANAETLDLAGKCVPKTRVVNQSAINPFFGTKMTLASGTVITNRKFGEVCCLIPCRPANGATAAASISLASRQRSDRPISVKERLRQLKHEVGAIYFVEAALEPLGSVVVGRRPSA